MLDDNSMTPKVKWLRNPKRKGEFLFTFDGERIFNLFRDYPHELTAEQKDACYNSQGDCIGRIILST
jgi:hypothetical protein